MSKIYKEDEIVPDYVADVAELRGVSNTLEVVCKDIADTLEKHYPGWLWTVGPNEEGGIINIFSLRLSGYWGYVMHIENCQGADRHKKALEAGGVILERYGLRRAGYSREQWKLCRKDFMGRPLADNSDQDTKVQRQIRDQLFTEALQEGKLELKIEDIEAPHGGAVRHISIRETPNAAD